MTKACPVCKGERIVIGMGLMTKKCDTCLGVGNVEIEEVIEAKPAVAHIEKKKRRAIVSDSQLVA